MARRLLTSKHKHTCETCDGEPAKKMLRLEEPHNKKGFMQILNHEFFDDKTLKRPGTETDVATLIRTFSKFNFEIELVRDLNYKQIKALVEQRNELRAIFIRLNR